MAAGVLRRGAAAGLARITLVEGGRREPESPSRFCVVAAAQCCLLEDSRHMAIINTQ